MPSRQRAVFVRVPPFQGLWLAHPQECQLPLSLAYGAACQIQAGLEVEVIDLWVDSMTERQLHARLNGIPHDWLILPIDSMNQRVVRRFARERRTLHRHPARRVAMGQYADEFPRDLLSAEGSFDFAVMGEPEITLTELVRAESAQRPYSDIPGLAFRDLASDEIRLNPARPLLADLDTLPLPAYEIFDLDRYAKQSSFVPIKGRVRWGWMLSSRGCPFGCLFCSPTLRKSYGVRWRSHSADWVADAAAVLVREHGCNALAFEDDVFSYSKARTLDLCRALEERRLHVPFTAQTHIATLDSDTIEALHRAGCRGLCMGVESGDDAVRNRLKSGSLPRPILLDRVRKLHDKGIALTLYFMIGSPGETLEQMEKSLELAMELKPSMVQLAFFTPYPGSPAFEKYGQGKEPEQSHYNRFTLNLSAAETREVMAFYRRFYREFYVNPDFIRRYARERLPYLIRQARGREWKLAARTLLLLLLPFRGFRPPWN